MSTTKSEVTFLTIRLPRRDLDRLKRQAKRDDDSVSRAVRQAIRQYLAGQEKTS
jgi:predicted transcriptional regulator